MPNRRWFWLRTDKQENAHERDRGIILSGFVSEANHSGHAVV